MDSKMTNSQTRIKEVRIVNSFRRRVEDTVKARRPAKAARSIRRSATREIYFQLMEAV